MSIEKHWHFQEYAKDIHENLREKEKKRLFYWNRSCQLALRKPLVTWMLEVSDKEGFNVNIRHLAVYLLDIFLDNHFILTDHLKMVASCCLILATKVEDNSDPLNNKFNVLLGKRYKLREFVAMEMNILSFFSFDVMVVTVANFTEYYSVYVLHPTDVVEGESVYDLERLNIYAKKYIEYFMDLTLLDTTYYKFLPSVVASAIILATRDCLSLCPPWPLPLQHLTGYKYGQLYPCVEMMKRTLNTETVLNVTTQVQDYTSSSCTNSSSSPSSFSSSPDSDGSSSSKSSIDSASSLPRIIRQL